MFEALGHSAPGVMWNVGQLVPVTAELGIVTVCSVVALALATVQFNRGE